MKMNVNFPERFRRFNVTFREIGLIHGATFTPNVDENGLLTWENDQGLENPAPVRISGADGFSPVVTLEETEGGVRLTVTDAEGTRSAEVLHGTQGEKGEKGADGFSPIVNVEKTDGVTTLTVTDAEGEKSVEIVDEHYDLNLENGAAYGSLHGKRALKEDNSYSLGIGAVAIGYDTKARGADSVAEGHTSETTEKGAHSHVEGMGTISNAPVQHIQGCYNKANGGQYAHVVGNGTLDARADIHTLKWSGKAWFKGDVYVGGDDDSNGEKLIKKSELDAALAAIPGGEGGGSGGSLPAGGSPYQMLVTDADGNTVWEDRTHWKEVKEAELLPETVLTEGVTQEPLLGCPEDGTTYTVTIDGTVYETTATDVSAAAGTPFKVWILGNAVEFTGVDTGEEYMVFVVEESGVSELGFTASVILRTGTATTLSINGNSIVYHKIPDEYLNLPEQTHWVNEKEVVILSASGLIPEHGGLKATLPMDDELQIGEVYRVNWNGTDYECTAVDVDGNRILGDASGYDNRCPATGEPFGIIVFTEEKAAELGLYFIVLVNDGSEEVSITITEPVGLVHKLDSKFLPDFGINLSNGKGINSVCGLYSTIPYGTKGSFAIGNGTKAGANYSFAAGEGTITMSENQVVIGRYNPHAGGGYKNPFVIGGGTSDNDRKTIFTVDWDGNVTASGEVTAAGKKLVTQSELNAAIAGVSGGGITEESDPTVPAWAKAETKPAYTADEVGAIPSPPVATVGQTIAVKAVDEFGNPTEWEAVDMASGGDSEEWELIQDITLEEDVGSIELTNLNLSKLRCMFSIQGSDANGTTSANTNFAINARLSPYWYYNTVTAKGNSRHGITTVEICNNKKVHLSAGNNNNTYQTTGMNHGFFDDGTSIDAFYIHNNGALVLGAGSKITVWGVRA